ncbi:ring-cleaving dioxygenase [Rhizobium sp. FKL33]|uniref:ring-cleaving dioxygenase n=1 Tax=Rhizobium sp. FKL33 TaxID=2562307 RepID=UPI0010BF904C|nr:ring-cleaving dioxygenase [Rhizobium sp. FKL33]
MTHSIHHITANSGNLDRTLDFYGRVLGRRLVKKTVNFEAPSAYHLYFGDETGSPGSILTFFVWDDTAPGRLGIGETQDVGLAAPRQSLGFWMHRFIQNGVSFSPFEKRFGETILPFRDPDGLRLALVGVDGLENQLGYEGKDVPAEHAVRGVHNVTLLIDRSGPTADILTALLGYRRVAVDGYVERYVASGGAGIIDLRAAGDFLPARAGAGSVDHIAFRARDIAELRTLTHELVARGVEVTEEKDRTYFKSVYFRTPGGVLFEIATDGPGFLVDEDAARLGTDLKLPAALEPQRWLIESALPQAASLLPV